MKLPCLLPIAAQNKGHNGLVAAYSFPRRRVFSPHPVRDAEDQLPPHT